MSETHSRKVEAAGIEIYGAYSGKAAVGRHPFYLSIPQQALHYLEEGSHFLS